MAARKLTKQSTWTFEDLIIAYMTGATSVAHSWAVTGIVPPDKLQYIEELMSLVFEKEVKTKNQKQKDRWKKRCLNVSQFVGGIAKEHYDTIQKEAANLQEQFRAQAIENKPTN